ncbi:glycosyltransferase [Salimicrobium sp. PL1-032A]|uniref:glycosyltransferase n=1 Tax=Salimicrobium sp. PL1-032A TaxID=3095364 RepID=UPI00326020CB
MKKILVISNMYPGARSRTFGVFVKNQVESLREEGMDVDVVSVTDPRMAKVHVLKKYIAWVLMLMRVFLSRRKSYDIIHAHYVFPSGFFGTIFRTFSKARLIVTAHGGDIDRMARKNKLLFGLTKRTLKRADHVIAAGEVLKRDITRDFNISTEKVSVLSMGVDRDVFRPVPKEEAKRGLGLDPDGYHVLFVGNLIRAKGLDELLTAFKRLAAIRTISIFI